MQWHGFIDADRCSKMLHETQHHNLTPSANYDLAHLFYLTNYFIEKDKNQLRHE